ncbi:MAG: class I SAM-dependent methyltransferase [Actinomycetota bacterium]
MGVEQQDRRARTVRKARQLLARGIRRSPRLRLMAERAVSELERALVAEDLYSSRYFGTGVHPTDRGKSVSGYAEYRRETSNLNVAAYIVYKHLRPARVVDIGAARGYLLEALSEVGVEGHGVDLSHDAIASASDEVRGRMTVASAVRLPVVTGAAPVVTAFETLEHLPPHDVSRALAELARATSAFVVATIPSFGRNDYGPNGWYGGKVLWEVLHAYEALGPDYEGPIPYHDLMRDGENNPIEGHLTIASFSWWTKRFAEAGLVRFGKLEEAMNADLGRFGLLGQQIWHLYVAGKPEAEIPQGASYEEALRAEEVLDLGRG